MFLRVVAAAAVTVVIVTGGAAHAQISTPASPQVGTPTAQERVGPPAPLPDTELPVFVPRVGPLPASLTLRQALEEAEARSPAIVAAQARVEAATARIRQAGFRSNPELSLEVENFLGTGELSGVQATEATLSVSQRLDLGGRRSSRVTAARAELLTQELQLAIARAELGRSVREQFARAITALDRLAVAVETEAAARELARVAGILVDAGRDPPLRAIRARSAAAQAAADLQAARAEEQAARATLAALFGVTQPMIGLEGSLLELSSFPIEPDTSLEVRLAEAERLLAEAQVDVEMASARLDPAVGVGVRYVNETGDAALVGGISMPLPIFDRNQGSVASARANVRAAEANLATARISARAQAITAQVNLDAATARVAALDGSAVPEAAEAARLAEISYREGRASLLELLDAREAYRTSQLSLIEAREAQAVAAAELARVAAQ